MAGTGSDRLATLPAGEARVRIRELPLDLPPQSLLEPLTKERDPVLLESSACHERYGRHSIAACRPLEVLTLRGDSLTDAAGRVVAEGREAVWSALSAAFSTVRIEGGPPGAAYLPGWIGYVGYEVGRLVERLPGRAPRRSALPDLRLAFYDAILLYDAKGKTWQLVDLEYPREQAGESATEALLRIAGSATWRETSIVTPRGGVQSTRAVSNFAPQAYREAVRRCIDYIAAGDIFQVNLSQRFTVPCKAGPVTLYRALRQRNPACYAAFMAFEAQGSPCAVLSSSPELFLRVRGREVETRPIKGTRPRTGEPAADEAATADLLASPKDNAELAMIVDLLRNDLGRVCEYGSVRVEEARRLEEHPTVYHLVATVRGLLRESAGPAELLRATFPGGSITGAPKIRAMEIIDELEDCARGVYTGCIGHVGVDGACEWNIAIRTIVCEADRAWLQVGGGIVADSTPDGEYQETLDKARALLEAISISEAAAREKTQKP